jgi:hypothetical protein
MIFRLRSLAASLALLVSVPATVAAQAAGDGGRSTFTLGPLGLSPTVTVGNVGVDTNVFSTTENQTRDFTFSITPAVAESMTLGRASLTGLTGVPLVYFQKAASQRSVGFQQGGKLAVNLIHLTPYVSASYGSIQARPNTEIDTRVQTTDTRQVVGAILRLGSRTTFDGNYEHGQTTFGAGLAEGQDIGLQLDRHFTSFNGQFRIVLTPITTFAVRSTLKHERFQTDSVLNNNSLNLMPGVEFKADARLSGSFYLGIRAMRPISPVVPQFTGLVGSSSLSYLMTPRTRLDGKFNRDVDFSVDPTTPYFLTTGGGVSVTQLVAGHVDAVAGMTRTLTAYRDALVSASTSAIGRSDRLDTFSVGTGYRFRINARVGFNLTYARRFSAIEAREFSGFQFGGTVLYGF